jgi:hypothetical protein
MSIRVTSAMRWARRTRCSRAKFAIRSKASSKKEAVLVRATAVI